jgi:hypothetical protein
MGYVKSATTFDFHNEIYGTTVVYPGSSSEKG